MKNLILIVFLLTATASIAQECPCIVPITPKECVMKCWFKYIKTASETDLKLIVGLSEETVRQIMDLRESDQFESLFSIKEEISNAEYKKVIKKMKSLNDIQNDYLNNSLDLQIITPTPGGIGN